MGREIRRVPPNWEHPRYTDDDAPSRDRIGEYKPLYEGDYDAEKRDWLTSVALWEAGKHPDQMDPDFNVPREWWDWQGDPPRRGDYVPYVRSEATWVQMYEDESEGTPLSPPFATPEELVDWLCANKDFWGRGPLSRETAEHLLKVGWASVVVGGIDGLAHIAAEMGKNNG